jgi:hypothetical protein
MTLPLNRRFLDVTYEHVVDRSEHRVGDLDNPTVQLALDSPRKIEVRADSDPSLGLGSGCNPRC